MELPASFVDPHPWRGPWHPVSSPPEPFAWTIQVLLPSGKTGVAMWTGSAWHPVGINPVAWRAVEISSLGALAPTAPEPQKQPRRELTLPLETPGFP